MSAGSKIEWTGATWNPVTGCTEVSEGCDYCYARTFAERWRGVLGHPFEQGFDVRLWPDRLELPLRWRKSRRVFVNSMSDLWQDPVPDEFIAAVWATMFRTSSAEQPSNGSRAARPQHTYQLLTKRPGRMSSWVRRWSNPDQRIAWIKAAADRGWCSDGDIEHAPSMPAVLPNAWLGVSVENQRWANVRLPLLAKTPAVVRFASCEPLLGPLEISRWLTGGLDWVIAGGESGGKARPMHPAWPLALRDQCQATGVPFFFKQWGNLGPAGPDGAFNGIWIDATGRTAYVRSQLSEPGTGLRMRRFTSKQAAGRRLDGRTWDEYPAPT
jgi:protein gp37